METVNPEITEHMKPMGFVTKSNNYMTMEDVTGSYASQRRTKQLSEDDSFVDKYTMHGLVEPPYPPDSLINLLEINTYHFRSCQTKASDAAGSGWHIQAKSKKPVESHKEKAEDFFHDLYTPLVQTLRDMLFDYEAIGWGAIEIIREDDESEGEIVDLKHIPAHTIRVHRSMMKYGQIRGAKTVWFKDVANDNDVHYKTGDDRAFGSVSGKERANELVFFKQYSQKSDFYGQPQILSALGAMLGDFEREEYNTSFFANQGVPAYAVFITGDYDPGPTDDSGRTDLEKVIEKHLAELSGNPHSTLLLAVPSARRRDGSPGTVNVVFQKLSEEVKEASFEKYRIANRNEVLAAHGVPMYRLGIAETGALGGSVASESTEIYKRSRIDPLQEMIHTPFNRHIMEEELGIDDYEWELDDLDTRDEQHDITVAVQLFNMGMMTPNDGIRHFGKKFGLEPSKLTEMDYHYIAGGAVELGLAKDPASDQGQRSAAEETQGMDSRGEREGKNSETERMRKALDDADIDPDTREGLQSMIPSERR